jgi:molybdate transport system substrate-binding protein
VLSRTRLAVVTRRSGAVLLGPLSATLLAAFAVAGATVATAASPRAHAGAQLKVFAAASLTKVFPQIDGRAQFQFAGSDVLQAQIQQGAPADVFASASPKQAQALFHAGLVDRPVNFATNTLVLIVSKRNPGRIHSIYDLRKRGETLVIGDSTVPVGAYTRQVLAKLHLTELLSHVKSNDTDVKQVVSQVALGQADAGFAYATDVKTSGGLVKSIAIPKNGQPRVVYQIAVVKSGDAALASGFASEVLSSRGRGLLKAAGFGLP